LLIWAIVRRGGLMRVAAIVFFAAISVLAYARFVEPRILITVEHDFALNRCLDDKATAAAAPIRLAVFSDMHIGLFGNAMSLERIAARVNKIDADAVLIAGDFVYWLQPARFDTAFAVLAEIEAPVYAVLGNHDVGLPGWDVSPQLIPSLKKRGLIIIDNKAAAIDIDGRRVEFAGVSDLWDDRQKFWALKKPLNHMRFALTHNPETVLRLPEDAAFDLMIAGHTHGGQINIPYATCALMPFACVITRYGFADTERGPVFVTSGTGMVGLPMRFNTPPRIDVLNVRYKACPVR